MGPHWAQTQAETMPWTNKIPTEYGFSANAEYSTARLRILRERKPEYGFSANADFSDFVTGPLLCPSIIYNQISISPLGPYNHTFVHQRADLIQRRLRMCAAPRFCELVQELPICDP